MAPKTLLILGGYGNTGKKLARLLVQQTDARLIVAGRRIEKAQAVATELNALCQEDRITALRVDAADRESLRQAFRGIDMVVVASSTVKYAGQVAEVALEAGIDYLDVQYSTKKVETLKGMAGRIEKAGLCFITDGGFHPGLPAALIRYGAQQFDALVKANVGSVIKIDWAGLYAPDETLVELVEELNDFVPVSFKDGKWQQGGWKEMMAYRTMDFGAPFGKQPCASMFLEELRPLPELFPTLKETGFFVGGFNWFVDWFVFSIVFIVLKFWPVAGLKPMGKLMKWGLCHFSRPPYQTILKLEAEGMKDGQFITRRISLSHPDGYELTAIPVAACLLQYLDGLARKPGLWTQANLVEPGRFIADMQRMGVEVQADSV